MKKIIIALTLALGITAAAASSRADPGSPRDVVEKSAQTILDLLNDPAFHNPATQDAQLKKIEAEVLALFDFEEFSTRAVGPQWRTFTADQKTRFQDAFTDLMRSTYVGTLDSYDGETFEFVGQISSDNGARVEIQMNFLAKGQTYPLAFRTLVKNDRWVVYDVIITSVSMIKNYRDQFRDILAKNDPEELIRRVQAKADEQIRNQSAAAAP